MQKFPKSAEIAEAAKIAFEGAEYKPIRVAVELADRFYGSSLEMNFHDVLRARYAERMIRQDKIVVENGPEFGLLQTVLNKATRSAYIELFNFLEWVASKAKTDSDFSQITDSYLPTAQWLEAFENDN